MVTQLQIKRYYASKITWDRCNRCDFKALRKTFTTSKIELRRRPINGFPGGVDVFIDGVWTTWYSHLPNGCTCMRRNREE
jgi:hypothetical protein